MTLTDTLDDLIGEQRMDPQLAMKVLSNFDRAIAETLSDKVKARLTFKVCSTLHLPACLPAQHAHTSTFVLCVAVSAVATGPGIH